MKKPAEASCGRKKASVHFWKLAFVDCYCLKLLAKKTAEAVSFLWASESPRKLSNIQTKNATPLYS